MNKHDNITLAIEKMRQELDELLKNNTGKLIIPKIIVQSQKLDELLNKYHKERY